MKDYIREVIYNNAFTPDDALNGKTGFVYWDSLEQKERAKLMVEYRKKMESMTPQEQAKLIDEFQAEIRKKQRSSAADDDNNNSGRLRNASSYDVIREILNVDMPKAIEEFKKDLDRHHEFELLAKLQGKTDFEICEMITEMIEEEDPNKP
jgi:hypothetical protein